jgi:hypothetical protein
LAVNALEYSIWTSESSSPLSKRRLILEEASMSQRPSRKVNKRPTTDYEARSVELLEQIAADLKWLRKRAAKLDQDKKADQKAIAEMADDILKSRFP